MPSLSKSLNRRSKTPKLPKSKSFKKLKANGGTRKNKLLSRRRRRY
jgi:hypothetical protein